MGMLRSMASKVAWVGRTASGANEFKGLSSPVSVPGALIYAACLQQSSGVELILDKAT
jgi:hypothetical protein